MSGMTEALRIACFATARPTWANSAVPGSDDLRHFFPEDKTFGTSFVMISGPTP